MLLLNQFGLDLLQGLGLNRDLVAREEVNIIYSGTSIHPIVDDSDTLTLRVENNTVASAQMTVEIYYAMGV